MKERMHRRLQLPTRSPQHSTLTGPMVQEAGTEKREPMLHKQTCNVTYLVDVRDSRVQ